MDKSSEERLDTTRKLLTDFYTTQLNIHGAMIVGVAVILFTVMQITVTLESSSPLQTMSREQTSVIVFLVFLITYSLCFYLCGASHMVL